MDEDNRTSDTIPDDVDVASSEGNEKVSAQTPNEGADLTSLSLEELNGVLGRQFKTKEGALKSIKDTYAFVGKQKGESGEKEATSSNEEIEALRTELYFTQNPDLNDARPILEALAKANGQSVQEAAQTELFQQTLSKIKGADQEKATVMEGNRRFVPGEDQQKEFADAVGNKEKMATYVLKNYLSQDK